MTGKLFYKEEIRMFYLINEELFHAVLTEQTGMWLISYQNPNAPAFYRNNELTQFQKSNPPSEYIKRNDTPIVDKS